MRRVIACGEYGLLLWMVRSPGRIDVDPVRGPLVARVFELYATGESLLTLTHTAYEIGCATRGVTDG